MDLQPPKDYVPRHERKPDDDDDGLFVAVLVWGIGGLIVGLTIGYLLACL